MRAYERLLEYVKVKTPSSEESMETPSSSCQFELAASGGRNEGTGHRGCSR